MSLSLLSSSSGVSFPVIGNVGDLFQVMPDSTRLNLTFSGNSAAPGESRLEIQHSVGGMGPWIDDNGFGYYLNGLALPNLPYNIVGPYQVNNYFRARWTNLTVGYVSPYYAVAGPTTKLRWDVTVSPIQPGLITPNSIYNNFGVSCGITFDVVETLSNGLNYSNKGVKITANLLVSNGGPSFSQVFTQYYTGWGAAYYDLRCGNGTPTILACFSASAQYYVLGDPLPGILSTPSNYP